MRSVWQFWPRPAYTHWCQHHVFCSLIENERRGPSAIGFDSEYSVIGMSNDISSSEIVCIGRSRNTTEIRTAAESLLQETLRCYQQNLSMETSDSMYRTRGDARNDTVVHETYFNKAKRCMRTTNHMRHSRGGASSPWTNRASTCRLER